jgi:hypothetical protein
VGCDFDVTDAHFIPCIDDSNFSVILTRILPAISDINELGVGLVDHAVGTRFKLDRVEKIQRVSSDNPDHGVVSACHK